jgi:hypothetical protein
VQAPTELQVAVVQGSPSLQAHGSQWSALAVALNVPSAHSLHTASLEGLAGTLTKVPAEQMLAGVHEAALLPLLKVFASQGVHTRSTVADGVSLTKVPARHVAHGVHEAEFGSVEKCWLAQAVQLRSLVGVPSLARKVPAGQTDFATHAVAGLLSWSQLPFAQGTSGLSPPPQYSPAAQAWQIVAEVEVPGATSTDPARQLPCDKQIDWLSPLEYCSASQGTH